MCGRREALNVGGDGDLKETADTLNLIPFFFSWPVKESNQEKAVEGRGLCQAPLEAPGEGRISRQKPHGVPQGTMAFAWGQLCCRVGRRHLAAKDILQSWQWRSFQDAKTAAAYL